MNFLRLSKRFLLPNSTKVQRRAFIRTLFTQETLDLTEYANNRQDASHNVDGPEKFKWELKCYLDNEPKKDLIQLKYATEVLVHLITSTTDDIDLIKQTLNELNAHVEFSELAKHTIGNLVMKSLHFTNAIEAAKEFYNDPELNVFFNGFKCTLLYLDLLYKSQGYQEIIEIDKKCRNTIWAKRTNSLKFIDVLVFGACYKLNTIDSYNYADELWRKVGESTQFKKTVAFFAALAYRQQKWTTALEVTHSLENSFIIEQIKLLSLIEMCGFNEVIAHMSFWTTQEALLKHKISKEVYDKVEEKLSAIPLASSQEKLRSILDELKKNERITDETIDDLLDRRISARIMVRGKRNPQTDLSD